MNNRTGYVFHELCMWHDTGNDGFYMPYGYPVQPYMHAENPETKRRMHNLIVASGMVDQLVEIKARAAQDQELLRFHTQEYLNSFKEQSQAGGGDYGGAPFGHGSYEIAKLSTGGVLEAVDAVIEGRVDNAYALVRPPGHHALADKGMGFCFFANAVLAGLHAMEKHGLERVAYIDWDVHHGNGTQSAFWHRSDALTISLHQDNCFPIDSGHISEVGEGEGEGYNINIPLPPGSGSGAYYQAFDEVVIPALQKFKPDMIFVACGFDAGANDPLGRMLLHSEAYRTLTQKAMALADELCDGRLLMCHEGGYNGVTVPFYGLAVVEQLAGHRTDVVDPFCDHVMAMAGHDLKPQEDVVIQAAKALIKNIK